MIKVVIAFMLGFLLAFVLLMFHAPIHIETNNKVLTSIERLPDAFFDHYEIGAPNSEGCYPIEQRAI
jgi:hypothetical protein